MQHCLESFYDMKNGTILLLAHVSWLVKMHIDLDIRWNYILFASAKYSYIHESSNYQYNDILGQKPKVLVTFRGDQISSIFPVFPSHCNCHAISILDAVIYNPAPSPLACPNHLQSP